MSLDPIVGGGAGGGWRGSSGLGGANSAVGPGESGGSSLRGSGGGGGGGAGAVAGGAGGAGGGQGSDRGGQGGAGGVHGYVGEDLPNSATVAIRGTDGEWGATVLNDSGGGGGGGYGVVLTGARDFGTLRVDLQAGNGGGGGASSGIGSAGGGGRGGIGLLFDSAAAKTIALAAAITGGNGGAGGRASVGTSIGGDGGEGILGENLTMAIVQGGVITGGLGGTGGYVGNSSGEARDGGAGIRGENLSITASGGTITGGIGGTGGTGGQPSTKGGYGGAGISGQELSIAVRSDAAVIGGDGGVGSYNTYGGDDGGDGGAGISGVNLAITEDRSITIASGGAVNGGNGGSGGGALFSSVRTGAGGNGGAGIAVTNLSLAVQSGGAIHGGNGGVGGDNTNGTAGTGGTGGAGISGENLVITIESGAMVAGGNGGAGGAGKVSPGAVGAGGVGISGADLTVTLGPLGSISGGRSGDGTTRADAIVFTGGTNIFEFQGGTITGNVGANGTNDTFRLGGGTDGTLEVSSIGSQFRDFEHFASTGTATWTFIGSNTGARSWTMSSGTIIIRAYLPGTAFTVGSGLAAGDATLSGYGAVGAVTVQSGGRVGPGEGSAVGSNSPGILSTGNFTLSNGGTLGIDIDIANSPVGTSYDQLKVTGSVTLGGTLDLSLLRGFTPATGDSFTIIDNDGSDAVSGTFTGLGQGAIVTVGKQDFQISYSGGTGNDVVLKAVAPPNLAVNAATVAEGETVVITGAGLKTSDSHEPANNLVYTITTTSPNGTLYRAGTQLRRNDTFTQDDIDNGLITYRHDGGETTEDSFSFDVSDSHGNTISGRSLSIDVTAVNDAPTVAGLDGDSVAFTEGDGVVLLDAGADAVLTDPDSRNFDGGKLTVSIIANGIAGEDRLVIVDQGMGLGTIRLSSSDIIYSDLSIIGSFAGGSDGNDLVITLNATADIAAVNALLGAIGYANTNTADPDTATRMVSITVSDGDGATSLASTVAVGVTAVNDAPVLADPLADQAVQAGGTLTYQLPVDTFLDADGDPLQYTAALANGDALPAWLRFDAASLTFVATPAAPHVGTVAVKMTASDGALSASDTFAIAVSAAPAPPAPANSAPTSISLSNFSVVENSLADTLVGTVTGIDPDRGDVLRFTLIDNPGNAFKIVDGRLLVADGANLDFETQASYRITIRATDAAGASKDQSFSIDIADVEEDPDGGNGAIIRGDRFDNALKGDGEDDRIYGYRGDDRLRGGAGDDLLKGGWGDDRLFGGKGDDVLDGGRGNDLLRGGGGADSFLFGTYAGGGFGNDTIADFNPGEGDRIVLIGIKGFTDFSDLLDNHVSEKGDSLTITADDGSTILLRGIGIADLGRNDFVF